MSAFSQAAMFGSGGWFNPVVGAVSAGANVFSQIYNNNRNIAFQERQNALNRSWALAQWHRENQYNSPAAQLARLREAGLNPQLMYGDGAAGMPAATAQSPEQVAPQTRAVQIDPMIMANIDLAKSQAEKNRAEAAAVEAKTPHEVQNLEEQNRHLRAQVTNLSSQDEVNFALISRYAVQNDLDRRNLLGMLELWNSEIAKNRAEMQLTSETLNQLIYFRQLKELRLDLENKEIQSRIGLNQAQVDHLVALDKEIDRHLETDYSENMVQFREDLMNAQADLADAQAYYWDDYTQTPAKYIPMTESHSWSGPFGLGGSGSVQQTYVPYRSTPRYSHNTYMRNKRRNSDRKRHGY